MNREWQVRIEYRPGQSSTYIYVMRRLEVGRNEFLVKGGDESKTVDVTSAISDEVYFARFEDDEIGSLLVEALDKRGIKAPSQSFAEGKLQATEAHLSDLRQMIPRLSKPTKE